MSEYTEISGTDVVELSLYAAKIMLESGGEIARTEQTAGFISKAFGYDNVDCFATPTFITISVARKGGERYGGIKRIVNRRIHLDKVDRINAFSRSLALGTPDRDSCIATLREIEAQSIPPLPLSVLASAMGTGAFAFLFGGGPGEMAGAFFVGLLLRLVVHPLSVLQVPEFVINLLAGALAAFLGWAAVSLGLGSQQNIITISALMLMVPGMMITNAIRDLASGDIVAGVSRVTEAFCIAAALACGAAVVSANIN